MPLEGVVFRSATSPPTGVTHNSMYPRTVPGFTFLDMSYKFIIHTLDRRSWTVMRIRSTVRRLVLSSMRARWVLVGTEQDKVAERCLLDRGSTTALSATCIGDMYLSGWEVEASGQLSCILLHAGVCRLVDDPSLIKWMLHCWH